jgi:hypothetical protein
MGVDNKFNVSDTYDISNDNVNYFSNV